LRPDDAFAHKTLVAISTFTDINDPAIFSGNGKYHFLSTTEAAEWFAKIFPKLSKYTLKVAERCNVELTLGKFVFLNFELEEGKTADQMLDELTVSGRKRKRARSRSSYRRASKFRIRNY
jgi:DNA polymerase-3 subunit alpha